MKASPKRYWISKQNTKSFLPDGYFGFHNRILTLFEAFFLDDEVVVCSGLLE